jgi:hypothetical protein
MGKLDAEVLETIEPGIRKLVLALNEFEGLQTVASCEGHPEKGGDWEVCFHVEHSEAGWFALEFLAWVANDCRRAGEAVSLVAVSPPPYLNGPGASLFFMLDGAATTPPDQFADFLGRMHEECFDPRPWPAEA